MIILTGGAGFIGSCMLASLNANGREDVLGVDSLGTGSKWKNLVDRSFIGIVSKQEFRDMMAVGNVDDDVEAIIHMGACSATTETDADYLYDNNYRYSVDVAEFAAEVDARFIYASSAATYGDGLRGYADTSTDLRPLNMYGYSKHLFDLHAQREGWLKRIVGVKYFNVFGPNEDHKAEMRSLVNKAYQQILTSGRVQLFKSHKPEFKDGEQMRDFLYVKDAVEMTLHFAEQATAAGGLYNLGSGEANTWLTLTRAIFSALGREPAIDFVDMPEVLRGKYQYFTQADTSKLRATGYVRPMTPLAASVRDYVQNHLVTGKKLGE